MDFASLLFAPLLLAAAAGGSSNDLVTCIDPVQYFSVRNVKLQVPSMLALAQTEPKDGSTQIQQLLSIRWLGEHPAEVHKDDKVRPILEAIAKGKRAQDAQGFAREYAAWALARIDSKPLPPPRSVPVDSLRFEAFSWFPPCNRGDSFLAGGVDLRASGKMKGAVTKGLFELLFTDADRAELYEFAETAGNVRVDRIAWFTRWDEAGNSRTLARVSGAFDPKRLKALLIRRAVLGNQEKLLKDSKGEPMPVISGIFSLLQNQLFAGDIALVGDSDIVVSVGRDGGLENVEVVRAGKKEKTLKGPLGSLLEGTPDQAIGLEAGELYKGVREKLGKSSFLRVPRSFKFEMTRDEAIRAKGQITLADSDEARDYRKSFGNRMVNWRSWLKAEARRVEAPKNTVDSIDKLLAGLEMKPKGRVGSLDVVLSPEVIQALRTLHFLVQKR